MCIAHDAATVESGTDTNSEKTVEKNAGNDATAKKLAPTPETETRAVKVTEDKFAHFKGKITSNHPACID